ncbi:hypothetical protein ANCDUO_13775 [Ancylostoma duodenale]|uniref:Peptidase A2 domain-containing protein n=1 Tax=Ancylostoma duodenale TaxID=51022 RepID=A0A0C2CI29_9BILA|nr:hypothetical protein ANCDUO_13775 [Ancylostoma duodenale]
MHVLSLNGPQAFFVTQIPIRANGIPMLALIDTGAGITVASQHILTLLGIFRTDPCIVPSAVGMAGIPIKFVGSASVLLQIGKQTLSQVVHFTESDCVPREADAYNIILGNDVLQRLPSWAVNYSERTFFVEGEPIPILTCKAVESPIPISSPPISVHASSTMVLPPASEVMVPCYINNLDPRWSVLLASGNIISDDGIMVSPAVLRRDHPHPYLSNPTEAPRVIFKDQTLTSAEPVLELPNGTIAEPHQRF